MSTQKRNRTPLKTVDRLNYTMIFAGKIRTFEKVILTFFPGEDRELMSSAEYLRLSKIVNSEVLNNNEPLLMGEVHTLMYAYKIKIEVLEALGLAERKTREEARLWRYGWEEKLELEQSLKIKEYFRSLPIPMTIHKPRFI